MRTWWMGAVLAAVAACSSAVRPDAGLAANRSVGEFSLRDLNGRRVRLSEHQGKVILLSFWATWCEPCQNELPQLGKIWERHRSRGFELLSINVDPPDAENAVREIAGRLKLEFPVLLDSAGDVVNRYNPRLELPYSVLLDRAGRIHSVHQGYVSGDEEILEEKIQALLGE
ncbi:MAG: TlpA family protein disulfide reductase [Myxococcales bacterium]|nr:TlpA family protein disulfide reductase [Myxococcales bacterium]